MDIARFGDELAVERSRIEWVRRAVGDAAKTEVMVSKSGVHTIDMDTGNVLDLWLGKGVVDALVGQQENGTISRVRASNVEVNYYPMNKGNDK